MAFPANAYQAKMGEAFNAPTATTTPSGLTLAYSSSNTNVATVNATTGAVTLVANGQTVITAKFAGNTNYNEAQATYTLTVEKADPVEPTLYFDEPSYTVAIDETFDEPVLNNPDGLEVTWTSSDESVATVDQTGSIAVLYHGETTITATFAGNEDFLPATASYRLVVTPRSIIDDPTEETFQLWIGDTQVTSSNMLDIMGDGTDEHVPTAIFDGRNTLILTNAALEQPVISMMGTGLTLYLVGANAINVTTGAAIQQIGVLAPLNITTSDVSPGSIAMTSENASAISGFSDLWFDNNLILLKPESGSYQNQTLTDAEGAVAKEAYIAVFIKPLVEETTVDFDDDDFITTDDDGNESDVDLSNTPVNDILYTLNSDNEDGYDQEDGSIVLNTVTTNEDTETANNDHTPGTPEFSEIFTGLTFLVPAGQGRIVLDVQTFGSYTLNVKIGSDAPQQIIANSRGIFEIPYDCVEATYVYVYNAGPVGTPARDKYHRGKKTTIHVKIYSVTVQPYTVNTTNPVNGIVPDYPGDENGNMTDGISPLRQSLPTDGQWYNLNGQRIDKPTQKGLFIHNGHKVVVK